MQLEAGPQTQSMAGDVGDDLLGLTRYGYYFLVEFTGRMTKL